LRERRVGLVGGKGRGDLTDASRMPPEFSPVGLDETHEARDLGREDAKFENEPWQKISKAGRRNNQSGSLLTCG